MKPLIQQVLGTPGGISAYNEVDAEGMPAGGEVIGTGLSINWQDGPLGRGEGRMYPNGAFVEDVLMAVLQRIRHYQEVADGRFRCRQNSLAITHIEEALHWLADRTAERELAGVEGTHGSLIETEGKEEPHMERDRTAVQDNPDEEKSGQQQPTDDQQENQTGQGGQDAGSEGQTEDPPADQN